MAALIHIFWLLNIVLTFFLLMNFLISSVGQSHETVLGSYLKTKYINNTTINEDTMMFERYLINKEKPFDCFILSFLEKKSENQTEGLMSKIRYFLTKNHKAVMEK